MQRQFTLEYWVDDSWYVGRLREVPGVFSQGESLAELEENIKDERKLLERRLDKGEITKLEYEAEIQKLVEKGKALLKEKAIVDEKMKSA